jgi:hypothetical protein
MSEVISKKLKYEKTPIHINMKMVTRKENETALSKIKTSSILWHLLKRYYVELLIIVTMLEFVYIIWTKLGL